MDQDPTGGGARPDSDGASTLDLSGRCVGSSYLLVRPIGQGATGTVWRGVDRSSGEPVAVKLLHESLLRQPELVTRFVQERTILLMLRHRSVVRVRDLFSVGGSLGLVMDLVAGGSLREHLREHRTLGPGEAARLTAQVAAALAETHELGVIHRDLKPDNILLHRTDGELETRLTDFGIARVLHTPGLTTTHAVVGTPHYMAPESFHSASVSPAADVYALGVLLYELVCGRTPYDSDSVHDLMRLHLEGGPERRPGIPDALWEIITGCLEHKPRLRPTAGELIADLSAVARTAAGAPALPPPADQPRAVPSRSAEPGPVLSRSAGPGPVLSRSAEHAVPGPAEPVHPSLAGFKLPAPVRRNQPASWRWGRPWATIAVVAAAMLASGVATTAWHMARTPDEQRAGPTATRPVLPVDRPPAPATGPGRRPRPPRPARPRWPGPPRRAGRPSGSRPWPPRSGPRAVTVDPAVGRRYQVVMAWTFSNGRGTAVRVARGNTFDR